MESLYSYGSVERGSALDSKGAESSDSLFNEALEGMGNFVSQHKLETVLIVGGTVLAAVASRGKILKSIGRNADDAVNSVTRPKPWETPYGIRGGVNFMESRSVAAPFSSVINPELKARIDALRSLPSFRPGLVENPMRSYTHGDRFIPPRGISFDGNPLKTYDQSGYQWIPPRTVK